MPSAPFLTNFRILNLFEILFCIIYNFPHILGLENLKKEKTKCVQTKIKKKRTQKHVAQEALKPLHKTVLATPVHLLQKHAVQEEQKQASSLQIKKSFDIFQMTFFVSKFY